MSTNQHATNIASSLLSSNMATVNVQEQENRLVKSIRLPLRFIVLIWLIHIFQVITPFDFGYLGVYPREVLGLRGILFSPLLHADFQHLISNSVPFFVLCTMLFFFYRRIAMKSFIMMYLLTGLAVWAFANTPLIDSLLGLSYGRAFHIGASGVVYALAAFMVFSGFFRRNIKAIILALIVVFLYGGMIWGVLPIQEGVSWESHLFGALVGVLTAYWYKEEIEVDEKKPVYSWETDPKSNEQSFFFERTIFDETKAERARKKEDDYPSWFSSNTWGDK